MIKSVLFKSTRNGLLPSSELREVLLDVEVALNDIPWSYVKKDVEMSILTPSSLLYLQLNALSQDYDLRKRARYLLKCKDASWLRWAAEYFRGLCETHRLKYKGSPNYTGKGNVVIV